MLLDYFEQETELKRLVTMADAEARLDKFICNNERPLLPDKGRVSRETADQRCKAQYKVYADRRRALRRAGPDGSD